MKIFLTNDDGYKAPGINALYEELSACHEVTLIAPDREKSAVSHSISLHTPLRITKIKLDSQDSGYAVNGTPVDCIKLGLFEVFKGQPDLVISGINAGGNLGVDINYSGTAAAAREGALNGLPCMAVSLMTGKHMDFKGMARFTAGMVLRVLEFELTPGTFLNINGPDSPIDQVSGVQITHPAQTNLSTRFDCRIDPRDRKYFWYGPMGGINAPAGTDAHAVKNNYISISPIRSGLTDDNGLHHLKDAMDWLG